MELHPLVWIGGGSLVLVAGFLYWRTYAAIVGTERHTRELVALMHEQNKILEAAHDISDAD